MMKLTAFCPFELDLPTNVIRDIQEHFKPNEMGEQQIWISADKLGDEIPTLRGWIIRGGYSAFDIILKIPKKEDEQMEERVV